MLNPTQVRLVLTDLIHVEADTERSDESNGRFSRLVYAPRRIPDSVYKYIAAGWGNVGRTTEKLADQPPRKE